MKVKLLHGETKYDRFEFAQRHHSEFLTRQREIASENKMSPDQAAIARSKRLAAEMQQTHDHVRMDRKRDRERSVKRQREAVGSSRLDTIAVTSAAVKYLKAEKSIGENEGTEAAVVAVLVGMIKQEERAMEVCAILERWRAWTDRGGMTIEDLENLEKNLLVFCNAACIMGLIRDMSTKGGKSGCLGYAGMRAALEEGPIGMNMIVASLYILFRQLQDFASTSAFSCFCLLCELDSGCCRGLQYPCAPSRESPP